MTLEINRFFANSQVAAFQPTQRKLAMPRSISLFDQTERLKQCALEIRTRRSDTYDLDQLVEQMKTEAPARFHNDNTLDKRVFFHQPRASVPMAGFVVPYVAKSLAA